MAIGIARTIGIDLMQNFAAPYLSFSIQNFWRRWHISLSQWLRDYLYISLGGSRHGYARKMGNLMVTMGLCGLWHGAGWNFVLWGLLHGIYLVIHNQVARFFDPWVERTRFRIVLVSLVSLPITYLAANYAWVYFRLATFSEAMIANRKIWTWMHQPGLPDAPRGIAIIFLIVLAMDLWVRFRSEMFAVTAPFSRGRVLAYAAVGAVFCVAGMILNYGQPTQQFIYFQF